MKKRQLSKSDIKELNEQLKQIYGLEEFLTKKDKVEVIEDLFVRVNEEPSFFYQDKEIIPTLKLILKNNFLKKITVDMGAVKFVASGADVMRPGIVRIEEGVNKDQIISIIDEKNQKPLAVGRAMFNSEEMQKLSSGKVIKNLHWVGDKVWNS